MAANIHSFKITAEARFRRHKEKIIIARVWPKEGAPCALKLIRYLNNISKMRQVAGPTKIDSGC